MAGLEIRGVHKVYPGGAFPAKHAVLSELDLTVPDGQLLVLVGPSGSGKTTILRLIAGLERPDAGCIRLGGRDLADVPAQQREVAMVFQHFGLYGHLSARQNIAFGLELRSGSWLPRFGGSWLSSSRLREIDAKVSEAAGLLGIAPLLERQVGELSGGERQRVALGRAIVRQPAIWLLDEPLASLDLPARLTLRREFKQLQQQLKTTTVYVTHDQAEALALADLIAVLDQGRIQQLGTPREVYDQPKNLLVARFFGSQPLNLLAGRIRDVSGTIQFQSKECPELCLPIPIERLTEFMPHLDRDVVVGVRPEAINVNTAIVEQVSDECDWPATVLSCEDLGESVFLQLQLANQRLAHDRLLWLARVGSFCERKAGTVVRLQFPFARTLWFDESSGMNLLPDG